MARVVVIGGGVGGLASAARLAVKGHEVILCEQSTQLGGMVQNYSRDGFEFELGPSVLTLPAVYRDLFLKTGASLEDSLELVAVPDGTKCYWSDGTEALIPSVGGSATARSLGVALGGKTDSQWRNLTKRAGDMWRIGRTELIEHQLTNAAALAPVLADRQTRRTLVPQWSLRKISRKLIKDHRARQLVEHYALSAGTDPRYSPAFSITRPYIEQTFGNWWITGGIHQLIFALATRCRERGVEIKTSTKVVEICIADDRVTAVRLADGTNLAADYVVANTDARLLDKLCPDSLMTSWDMTNPTPIPTYATFSILAAVRNATETAPKLVQLAHSNIFFSPNPDQELNQLSRGEVPTDPTIRICAPQDRTMAPPGHESWTIQVTVPLHSGTTGDPSWSGVNWNDQTLGAVLSKQVFNLLDQRGLEFSSRLVWHEVRTPADIEQLTGSPGGSSYGSSRLDSKSNIWNDTWIQPTITTPIAGLFLTGGSVQPGPGLSQIGIGAEVVANTIGRAKRRKRLSSE